MVQAGVSQRAFDGVNPTDVCFGADLGEGKSSAHSLIRCLDRCVWPGEGGLAALESVAQVRHQVHEEDGDHPEQTRRPH